MEILSDLGAWAWARHHNVLSWYIRPLFIIPYAYFAYKRSPAGIIVTILALLTSMFWFPAPSSVDPGVERFLRAERDYLLGPWTLGKVLASMTVPAFFYALALAFWRRSWGWGAAVINLAAIGKVVWSVTAGGESGWAVLIPAVIGALICNGAVYFGVKRLNRAKARAAS